MSTEPATVLHEEGSGAPIARELVSPSPAAPPEPTSGREDYDAAMSFQGMAPGEPWFLLKGHDLVAARVVRAYAAAIAEEGADPAMVESALQLADKIDAFPDKRLVDADHLTPPAAAQLRYQFGRRAQLAAGDAERDVGILLAEERAHLVLISRLRPTLRTLFEGLTMDDDGRWTFDARVLARGEPKEGLRPTPNPIDELHALHISLGRQLPPETIEAQLIDARTVLADLLDLKRMKAREGATLAYQRRKPQVWARAQQVLGELGGIR